MIIPYTALIKYKCVLPESGGNKNRRIDKTLSTKQKRNKNQKKKA